MSHSLLGQGQGSGSTSSLAPVNGSSSNGSTYSNGNRAAVKGKEKEEEDVKPQVMAAVEAGSKRTGHEIKSMNGHSADAYREEQSEPEGDGEDMQMSDEEEKDIKPPVKSEHPVLSSNTHTLPPRLSSSSSSTKVAALKKEESDGENDTDAFLKFETAEDRASTKKMVDQRMMIKAEESQQDKDDEEKQEEDEYDAKSESRSRSGSGTGTASGSNTPSLSTKNGNDDDEKKQNIKSVAKPGDPRSMAHLENAEDEAMEEFEEIKGNIYQNKSIGQSHVQQDDYQCECRYDPEGEGL